MSFIVDLFHQAIIQSGVVLNPWALQLPSPTQMVYRICTSLGNDTRNHEQIMDLLRSADRDKISLLQEKVLTDEVLSFIFHFHIHLKFKRITK